MRLPLSWLRDFVDAGTDVPGLAHALTMAGLEIEGIERAAPAMSGIVVADVRAIEKHPDAEKLNVCRVWDGQQELQIVCGASNVRVGMKAPLATVGGKLPDGTKIKRAKLRGVESFGMLCSARELGLSDDASGLMELPGDAQPGQDLIAALGLNDTIFEVNLTPNRGDCMSVLGIAREVAAARNVTLQGDLGRPVASTIADTFEVRLEAGEGCPKFAGRIVRGVRAGAPSPFWMQERLRRAGLRPINAVVDVTNYVMLELGQPMHAYDLSKLHGAVIVRWAKPDETLTLLDGRTIALTDDIMVIADERGALGMAGVMGGEDSGIADTTTDIFLEVAYFTPAAVAGRGRRFGLITDASQRFERGVDPQLPETAIERATQLLLECAGGQAGPVTLVQKAAPERDGAIHLRHARIETLLGVRIAPEVVTDLLARLGMKATLATNADAQAPVWTVVAPSWRFDIKIEADLIEEVARLYGFDNIPEQDAQSQSTLTPYTETQVRVERVADLLVDRGYQEAITYSFTDPSLQSVLFPDVSGFALSNPISAELAAMRLSLWPGLLKAVGENQRRQQPRVRLFETGRRFDAAGAETPVVAGVAAGAALPTQWGVAATTVDFFDIKADVEALLTLTGDGASFRFVSEAHPSLHPGQSAAIYRADRRVGWLGTLHPEQAKRLDLTYPVVLFEIELLEGLAARVPQFQEISKYPAISRDIAVIVDEAVTVEALRQLVREQAGALLKDLALLSVYRGQQIEKGKKSIALGLNLQDTSRTLTDQDADALVSQVVASLSREFNATIRDR